MHFMSKHLRSFFLWNEILLVLFLIYSLCFQITFNNRAHSGKIKIYFDSDTDIQECKDWHIFGSGKYGARVFA